MSEGEGIEPVLNKIRKRSEARREYEGRPTKFVDLLTRGLRDPGKLPTTEESASEEVLEQIEKKASRVREWLGKNGNRANEGISEDFKYRDFIGREEVYFEDLKNVRWLKEGVVDKDFILINSDFDPDQEGYDLDLQGATGERSVIISLSSERRFSLSVGFYDSAGGDYHVSEKPFSNMDADQAKIINFYLDEAVRRFEIPEVT